MRKRQYSLMIVSVLLLLIVGLTGCINTNRKLINLGNLKGYKAPFPTHTK